MGRRVNETCPFKLLFLERELVRVGHRLYELHVLVPKATSTLPQLAVVFSFLVLILRIFLGLVRRALLRV